MAEYVAFDPNVEVLGQAIQSVVHAVGKMAEPVMQEHGLADLDSGSWYPIQNYLDAYRALQDLGSLNNVAIGMQIPDQAAWPPEVQTIEQAMNSLSQAYQMNHRGGDFGYYKFEKSGEREGKMICYNPYPSDLDFGIIYRLAQKFLPDDSTNFAVKLDNEAGEPNRKQGGDTDIFLITW